MSILHGKWSVEDIRAVMLSLDEKTGMNGGSLPIYLRKTLGTGSTLGIYHPSSDNSFRYFSFSLAYFNDADFKDLAAIDVIRHEYCHYLVDALELKSIFGDEEDHGIAWKTVCGLCNTESFGLYRERCFGRTTSNGLLNASLSKDIPAVNIIEQIDRWGLQLPSLNRRKYLEKQLIKKFTKVRVFSVHDHVVHSRYGEGMVIDTMPAGNKQLLYVKFNVGEPRVVQNRQVYKIINGQIKKPNPKAR